MSQPSMASLGKPIALGRTAEVYAWGDGQVLKLFHDWMSTQAVEYKAEIAQAVHATGLPDFKLRPDGQQQFAAWYPIIAAGRLSEDITAQQDWLIAQVKVGLA